MHFKTLATPKECQAPFSEVIVPQKNPFPRESSPSKAIKNGFLLQFVSIYILMLLSADDNRSIYIEMKKKNHILKCLVRGRFPGRRVFFGGQLLQKMGLGILLGVVKCLK